MSYQFITATTHSDETHLESFIDSLTSSSFPSEIRRTLEHLRYLNDVGDEMVEDWRNRQDDCIAEVRGAMIDFKERWEQDLVDGTDAEQVGRKRKRQDDGGEIDEVDGKNTASDATRAVKSEDGEQKTSPSTSSNPQHHIPSNLQILNHLHTNHPQIFTRNDEITQMHADLQQLSAERIQTAHQLKGMVEMALGRLNRDLKEFEKELGIEHVEDEVPVAPSAPVPAVAARASVPTLDKATIQNLGLEKKPIKNSSNTTNPRRASISTTSSTSTSTPHPSLLSRSNSAALPISTSASSARPKNLAAIQLLPNTSEWILAKIISYDKSTKTYTLSDEDALSTEIYSIPSSRVIALNKSSVYTRGDVVYAVYPDTTSFYLATVSTSKNNFVMVHFRDDGDEHGVTHEKAVPVWLVMRVPGK
jgi:hypothetical protein